MSEPVISRFGHLELSAFPADLQERVGGIAEKTGFVPNVFRALARRPAELRAFCDYHDALMDRDDGLSKTERELIVVATSAANRCTYCIVAHGAVLRIRSKNQRLADEVAANPWGADLTPRQRAIVDLALVLALDSPTFGEQHITAAREAGLTDDEVWDIGAITALFALSNRLAHLLGLRANDEFFTMARAST
jgi:uncharacterized peroxidase-related enzyme